MTTRTIGRTGAHGLGELAHDIGRALAAMRAGLRAARDWRRLSAMSDAALACEGLTRDGIARAVLERNLR